jgi:hypothetical protein
MTIRVIEIGRPSLSDSFTGAMLQRNATRAFQKIFWSLLSWLPSVGGREMADPWSSNLADFRILLLNQALVERPARGAVKPVIG